MSADRMPDAPRPWVAAGRAPTPEELAHFLAICTHEQRVAFGNAFLVSTAQANECFSRNHEGDIDRLSSVIRNRVPVWWLPGTDYLMPCSIPERHT